MIPPPGVTRDPCDAACTCPVDALPTGDLSPPGTNHHTITTSCLATHAVASVSVILTVLVAVVNLLLGTVFNMEGEGGIRADPAGPSRIEPSGRLDVGEAGCRVVETVNISLDQAAASRMST